MRFLAAPDLATAFREWAAGQSAAALQDGVRLIGWWPDAAPRAGRSLAGRRPTVAGESGAGFWPGRRCATSGSAGGHPA
eukprot:235032-Chlamydomonas_euryale.AAC.1